MFVRGFVLFAHQIHRSLFLQVLLLERHVEGKFCLFLGFDSVLNYN